MEALSRRHSGRSFVPTPLPYQTISNLLWAAYGINRPESKGRTAPSAINCQEVDIYLALPAGAYSYEPFTHSLHLVVAQDVRRVTGYQDFVAEAPLDLIYIANHDRMKLVPPDRRDVYASASSGAIAQNVYLFCASEGLSTVIRAWIAFEPLGKALRLRPNEHVLFSQTVGHSAPQ